MKPMLLGKSETLTLDDEWSLELKFDGIRAILTHDVATKIETRNEKDITVSFPEIAEQSAGVFGANRVMLDGEIVGFDGRGMHKLNYVQHRLGVIDPDKVAARQRSFPVVFVAFDILQVKGRSVMALPLSERRELLEGLLDDQSYLVKAQVYPVKMMDALWDFVQDNNLEGLVAKRNASKYSPGTRSPQWLKIKHQKMRWR